MDVNFVIIPSSEQFHVKLGYPWLSYMKAISSPILKCLKFPHNGEIITVNHSLFHPSERSPGVPIDLFWLRQFQSLPQRSDSLFQYYQKWKKDMILSLSQLRSPTIDIHILLEDEILPLMNKTNLPPKEDLQSILVDVTMPYLKKNNNIPPKVRPIPPPHDGPSLLPTPNISPSYGTVPRPSSYREKRLAPPLVQPKRPQPKPSTIKEKKIPTFANVPPPSQPSTKT